MTRSPEIDVHEQMAAAAADLEVLTTEYEARTRQIEHLEAVLDALLDDPDLDVCLVREDMRIHAISRGMAERRSGARSAIGRPVGEIADTTWGDLGALVASLSDDRWEERRVEGGSLRMRRAAGRGPDGGATYVMRFVET
jgi:hypothetical protein